MESVCWGSSLGGFALGEASLVLQRWLQDQNEAGDLLQQMQTGRGVTCMKGCREAGTQDLVKIQVIFPA